MKLVLVALGVLAWAGVGVLALAMAEWDEPVWGYFPILLALIAAWAIGEYVSWQITEREG
jgi:hypothetical protein